MEVLHPPADASSEPGFVNSKEQIRYTKKDLRVALAVNNAQKNGLPTSPVRTKKETNPKMSNRRKIVKGISPLSVASENAYSPSFTTASSCKTLGNSTTSLTGLSNESPYSKFSQPLEPIKPSKQFGSEIDLPDLSSSASVKSTPFKGPVNPKGSKYVQEEEYIDPYEIPREIPHQYPPLLPQIPARQCTFLTQNQAHRRLSLCTSEWYDPGPLHTMDQQFRNEELGLKIIDMEDYALSLQDLYPVSVNSLTPGSTITAFVLEGTKLKTPELRSMSYNAGQRTRTHEDVDFSVNPDPVPFQPQNFIMTINNVTTPIKDRSSTSLKKVPLPKRHLDSFGGYEYTMGAKRGLILHTDRYQWDGPRIYEGMSQRDRLRAEIEYMERLRGVKRRREMLPHRAQLDLLMGGKKVEFVERFDINKEIQKLKSLVMPTNARDLFHGRGFKLPDQHSSIKPRKPPILDYDSDEDISSAPASLQRHYKGQIDPDGIGKTKYGGSSRRSYESHLPRINTRSSVLGLGSSAPILLSKEKRTVDQIKARINIPADDPHRGKKAISLKIHDMMGEAERFSEEGHWTPIISHNRQGASAVYLKRSRTNIQSKYDNRLHRSTTSYPQEKALKVTTGNESVKRVDLTSPHPSTKSAPVKQTKPAPESDVNPPNTEFGSEIRITNPEMDEDLGIVDVDDTTDRNTLISHVSKTASPVKSVTPNPLKGSELPEMISETERNELKEKFVKLDTDSDGHLMYSQVQSQLPNQLTSHQERFLKQVYDITSSSTFFGVDEFLTMSSLTKTVTNLNEVAVDSFQTLDFADLHDNISNYVQMFQVQDRGNRGKISLEALKQVLSQALEMNLQSIDALWGNIIDVVSPSEEIEITKIEFLAHIPYFMSLKT